VSGRVKFTKAILEAVEAPDPARRVVVWDSTVPGLGLYCTPAGRKSFFLQATFPGGHQSKMKLGRWRDGDYPEMTITMARSAAKTALGLIAQGVDPRSRRLQDRRGATFGDLWTIYLSRHAKPHKRTWRSDVSQYDNHLKQFAGRKLSDITRGELAMFHVKLMADPGPATANRVLAQAAVMLELARDWGLLAGDNPARRIKKAPTAPRQRAIEKHEFPAFFRAVCAHPNATPRDVLLMCLFTGARCGNVKAMRWDEIDLDAGRWLIPVTKNGSPHGCPLTQPALEVLALRKHGGPWVFPGRNLSTHVNTVAKNWATIKEAAAKECPSLADLRIHDLRRTMASWQARTGASLAITSASLAHKSMDTTRRVYAVVDIEPARMAMSAATSIMEEMGAGKFVVGGYLGNDAEPESGQK